MLQKLGKEMKTIRYGTSKYLDGSERCSLNDNGQ